MKYTLMHKNIPVMDVTIDEENGTEFGNLYNPEHIPLGVFEAQNYDGVHDEIYDPERKNRR